MIHWISRGSRRVFRRVRHFFTTFIWEAFCWDYESCEDCGNSYRICCNIDNDKWEEVTDATDGGGPCVCPDCFIRRAEERNVEVTEQELGLWYFDHRKAE